MVSCQQSCCLSSQLVHLLLLLFSAQLIFSLIATGIFHGTCCTGRMLLCTSRCSSPGRQSSLSKTSAHSSNIFFLESRSPFVFLFVILMPCISSYPWSLFTFRVTKLSAGLANAKTGIWSLLDSLHILYQLRHMVSWLIHHSLAISIYFLKVWDSHLGAVYRRLNVNLNCIMHHCQFYIPRYIYCFLSSSV